MTKRRIRVISDSSPVFGMGVHAQTESGRKFVETQSSLNQLPAARADQVIFMVSYLLQ